MSKRLALGIVFLLIAMPALAEKEPFQIVFLKFKTEEDMPEDDGRGNGVEITDGKVDRRQHAIGVQLRTTRGTEWHEEWTVQFLNPAGEIVAADTLVYDRLISGTGTNCWFGVCGGLFLSTWRTFTGFLFPSCAIAIEPDWRWRVLWQWSDSSGNFSEAEVVREGTFEWVLSKGALSISADKTIVNPASENSTGGSLFTTFAGGTAGITVTAAECGQIPPQPITVTLDFEVVPHSGGHNHDAPEKALVAALSQTSATTDNNGKAFFGITGRTVASFIKLKAETTDWDTTDGGTNTPVESEEFNMAVGITGLQRFAADNTFVFATGDTTLHPDNIYGQPEMLSFINLFARAYFDETEDRIQINDASLALGGKFDIHGGYTGSHAFHRFGVDVDISRHVIKPNGSIEFNGLNVERLTALVTIWLGGTRYPEGPIHYRFPADGIDEIIQTRILP